MSLIGQVLEAVQASNGVVNLMELSRQLNIQPTALRDILDFCAQKGVLMVDKSVVTDCACCNSAASVCNGCSLSAKCGKC